MTPAARFGDRIVQEVSMTLAHGVSAPVFAVLGVITLLNVGHLF